MPSITSSLEPSCAVSSITTHTVPKMAGKAQLQEQDWKKAYIGHPVKWSCLKASSGQKSV